jgi:hypothetical protein
MTRPWLPRPPISLERAACSFQTSDLLVSLYRQARRLDQYNRETLVELEDPATSDKIVRH